MAQRTQLSLWPQLDGGNVLHASTAIGKRITQQRNELLYFSRGGLQVNAMRFRRIQSPVILLSTNWLKALFDEAETNKNDSHIAW